MAAESKSITRMVTWLKEEDSQKEGGQIIRWKYIALDCEKCTVFLNSLEDWFEDDTNGITNPTMSILGF